MSTDDSEAENNARIFGILSLVFSFIPVVGLTLGIIATQKGRNDRSSFAVTAGWIGILLSLVIAGLFGYWQYTSMRSNEKYVRYEKCIQDRTSAEQLQLSMGLITSSGIEAQCDWARP